MEYLTKNDLRKLSNLCAASYHDCRDRLKGAEKDHTSDLEKEYLKLHIEWMNNLMCKLDRIADSNAKRIEITI